MHLNKEKIQKFNAWIVQLGQRSFAAEQVLSVQLVLPKINKEEEWINWSWKIWIFPNNKICKNDSKLSPFIKLNYASQSVKCATTALKKGITKSGEDPAQSGKFNNLIIKLGNNTRIKVNKKEIKCMLWSLQAKAERGRLKDTIG